MLQKIDVQMTYIPSFSFSDNQLTDFINIEQHKHSKQIQTKIINEG